MTETELVFTDLLHCNRLCLYLNKDRVLDKRESAMISSILRRRIKGMPVQYILGKTEFMGLEFKLTPDVFIPRTETEILVETAIRLASGYRSQAAGLKIMDIGTGSGNIAISLAKFLEECTIVAVDISQDAIVVAKNNALLNKVAKKISFINQDFFNLQLAACGLQPVSFDFIIANPPYIPTVEIKSLQPELSYEPFIALDGGSDGLSFYRRIIKGAVDFLRKGGVLIMEIGFNQAQAIKGIFDSVGRFDIIEVVKDYQSIDRVIVAELK